MSTPKSSKNQQPPYSKDENKSVIWSLPSQLFQQNILKASHPVASKQITTSFYSFFLLQSAFKDSSIIFAQSLKLPERATAIYPFPWEPIQLSRRNTRQFGLTGRKAAWRSEISYPYSCTEANSLAAHEYQTNPDVKKWTSMSEGRDNFAMLEDWLFIEIFLSI